MISHMPAVNSLATAPSAAPTRVTRLLGERLELVEDLGATYHTYEMNGQVELKTTFWFRARHAGDDTPGVPQAEEGITAIRWVAQPVPEEMLAGTFASLRKLVEDAGGG